MAVKYKQRCIRCKKNYVLASRRDRYVTCYDCQKKELSGEIKDPEMKKLFDIPEEFYKENNFLRSIKRNYLTYENLTERQIEVFKKVVQDIKEEKAAVVSEAKPKSEGKTETESKSASEEE